MLPGWTLKVEGLGKLAHAEVRPRPLMLFVGENNSGKSYLASFLWGLLTDRSKLFPADDPAFWQDATHWLQSRVNSVGPGENLFNEEGRLVFKKIVQNAFKTRALDFARYILNNNSVELKNASLEGIRTDHNIRLRYLPEDPHGVSALSLQIHVPSMVVAMVEDPLMMRPVEQMPSLIRGILADQICFGSLENINYLSYAQPFNGGHQSRHPIYLPASRTGFMLLYRSVAANLMNRSLLPSAQDKASSIELTLPMIQFLNILATDLGDELGPYAEEADFLERELQGKVEKRPGVGFNYFHFRADGAPKPLPMNLASSLVTELSPIILVLRHMKNFPVLILEEPEAHLHPKLQRKLAQVIVRLIRKGLWVWVTTHSENFCQQINNFIKIGSISNRIEIQEKLGYAPQDYLNLDEVAGYQFELDEAGEKATASEIPISEQGFAMRSFNRELRKLSRETAALQEAVNQR